VLAAFNRIMPRTEPGTRPPTAETSGQSSRLFTKQKASNGGHSVSKSEDWSAASSTGKAKRVDWGAFSDRAGKGALPPEEHVRGAPGHNPFDSERRTSSAENDDPAVLQSDWFKLLSPQVRAGFEGAGHIWQSMVGGDR
jgi:hypothetical protein